MSYANLGVALVALWFLAAGLYALAWPTRVLSLFGIPELTVDGRNEIRSAYGGFGLGYAIVLPMALLRPEWAAGICLTVGTVMLVMAFGRALSRVVDGSAGLYPWLFFGIELVLAAILLVAVFGPGA